ncbi:hypothetical protein AYI68_g6806 [Smittium mucronatum]|uniref:Uncharacterized protein n=1 Tax=Smittium mucronatum TaxID=133383 RepID=A0A1R0GQF8_9FUNG|nr:hypothetical protein AYI68_g6806 [Smittium mucronatum]
MKFSYKIFFLCAILIGFINRNPNFGSVNAKGTEITASSFDDGGITLSNGEFIPTIGVDKYGRPTDTVIVYPDGRVERGSSNNYGRNNAGTIKNSPSDAENLSSSNIVNRNSGARAVFNFLPIYIISIILPAVNSLV